MLAKRRQEFFFLLIRNLPHYDYTYYVAMYFTNYKRHKEYLDSEQEFADHTVLSYVRYELATLGAV